MIEDRDREFDDETPEEIARILSETHEIDLARSVLERDLEKAQRAEIDLNRAVEVLVTAHSTSRSDPWISDIYGVGTVRACRLLQAGYTDLEAIAKADADSLADIHGISRDFAKVFIEHAQELTGGKESTAEAIASATDRPRQRIEKDLGSLGASGVRPSRARQFLISQYNGQSPRLIDIDSVDTRIAYFLTRAGLETPEDVASASLEKLTDVRYIGDSNVHTIRDSAHGIISDSETKPETRASEFSPTARADRTSDGIDTDDRTAPTIDSSYDVACFGGFTPFELVQKPEIGREITGRIAEEVQSLDVDCVLYTGARTSNIDTVGMDFSTAVETTVEVISEASFDVPVGFVLGAYDAHERSIENDRTAVRGYADHPPLQTTGFPQLPDGIRYVPADGTVRIGGLSVTQNPNIAGDSTLLLTHTRLSEQDIENDAAAIISGDGIHGKYSENQLNTIAVSYDPGPSSDVIRGGYHVLTIDSTGIQTESFQRLGRVGQLECWDHTDQGRQYLHGPTECPYCENTDVSGETEPNDPLRNQDPTGTTWSSTLVASSQLELTNSDLNAYYSAHDVLRPAETSRRDIVAENTAAKEIDEDALEVGLLQGEWILSCPSDAIDRAWQRTRALVVEGEFYDARVSTKLRVTLSDSDRYYLSVAVPNYFDRNDVARVKELLRRNEIASSNAFFKPLIYSKWRITGDTKAKFGLERTTRYRDLMH